MKRFKIALMISIVALNIVACSPADIINKFRGEIGTTNEIEDSINKYKKEVGNKVAETDGAMDESSVLGGIYKKAIEAAEADK